MSKLKEIIKQNHGILLEMSKKINLSTVSIRKILNTGKGRIYNKQKIIDFLEQKKLIGPEENITNLFKI